MALSAKTIGIVKATAPVVAEHALQITSAFYSRMFKNNPEVNFFFNEAHQVGGAQPRALADSVVQYATHIDKLGELGPLVAKIAHRHCALSVQPEHYPIVHENLMGAIGEVLGEAVTPEIGGAWSEAVLALADICIGAEEALYKEAESKVGGWRCQREFEVEKKELIAEDTMFVRFKPTDGYDGVFEYEPGQHITLRIPETEQAPRHYSLINKPNSSNGFEVSVRREEGGLYSNYIHDLLEEGQKVMLGAPMGVFHNQPGFEGNMAWVAGGVGAAPMRAFLQEYGPRVKAGVVVNKTPERAVFQDEMESAEGSDVRFIMTQDLQGQHPDMKEQADFLVEAAGVDANFFICGPTSLMVAAEEALREKGATNIFNNVYGTGTVQTNVEAQEAELKCPFGH